MNRTQPSYFRSIRRGRGAGRSRQGRSRNSVAAYAFTCIDFEFAPLSAKTDSSARSAWACSYYWYSKRIYRQVRPLIHQCPTRPRHHGFPAESGGSLSSRQTSQLPISALLTAKPPTIRVAQVSSARWCVIHASAADTALRAMAIQNRGLRGWNRRYNFIG